MTRKGSGMAKSASTSPRTATRVDIELGARIRARRSERKMSQEQLAAAIGVTFQQVQKYEKGVNRVAASTLVDISDALGIAAGELLPSAIARADSSVLASDDLIELTRIFSGLDGEGRATLLNVGRALHRDAKRAIAKRPKA